MFNSKTSSSIFALWLVLAFTPQMGVMAQAENPGWTRKVMFSLGYGSDDRQLNVHIPPQPEVNDANADVPENDPGMPDGPSGLAVGRDRIYIADRVSGIVKVFDPAGTLLYKTSGSLENLSTLAVTDAGDIYTISGAALNVLTKINANGGKGWRRTAAEVLPEAAGNSFSRLYIGPDNAAMVKGTIPTGKLSQVSPDGTIMEQLPGDIGAGPKSPPLSLTLLEPNDRMLAALPGPKIRGFKIQESMALPAVSPDAPALRAASHLFPFAAADFDDARTDPNGLFYTLKVVVSEPIDIRPGLTIATKIVIRRRLDNGVLLSFWDTLTVSGSPIPSELENITVDKEGNVWNLEFQRDTIEVVRYTRTTPFGIPPRKGKPPFTPLPEPTNSNGVRK